MRRALLALVLCVGCASMVRSPSGATVAIAVGHAHVDVCDPGVMDSASGGFVGQCVRVAGGDLSSSFVGVVSLLASAAVAWATSGALW